MAFRRGRRRFQGRWFPTVQSMELPVSISVPSGGSTGIDAAPIIPDGLDVSGFAPGGFAATGTAGLAGVVGPGSSYLIKRIVGSIYASVSPANFSLEAIPCAAALFVDRVDSAGVLNNIAAWDLFAAGASAKRWLWRRTWMLQAQAGTTNPFPGTNAGYGSLREGTHCDSKVKARVTYEERLFIAFEVQAPTGMEPNVIDFRHNLRLFAYPTMRDNR